MAYEGKKITIEIPSDPKAIWAWASGVLPPVKWVLLLLLLVAIGGWVYSYFESQSNANAARQLRGEYTLKEVELLKAKAEIGQLQSTLTTQANLEKVYKASILGKDSELARLKKQYKLEVDSYTHTIAILQGHTSGGQSVATTKPTGEVHLDWWDPLRRFHLQSENIFEPSSFEFTYSQVFSIDMVVFKQPTKDGDLRVQSVQLNELNPKTGEVIQKAELDLSKSSFTFGPSTTVKSGPAQHFLVGLSGYAEPVVAWEPYRVFKSSLGFSLMGYRSKAGALVGAVGLNYYPSFSVLHSNLGFGVSVGYSSDHTMEYRAQVVFSILSIGK